ncbi:MAG TPA: glycosyltransferase family 4 protein [Ktedonobacterales bacterium]|nr:glycosyltransferase family 4 protein [Ktedonobacterales bacterium]
MRIAQVVPLQVAVPPHKYGGTERVVYNLTEALVTLGHDVTLFATGDSRTSAKLAPGLDRAINFDPAVDAYAHHIAFLKEVYAHADEFDVIHSHLDFMTGPFAAMTRTPTVLTLHGRLDQPEYSRVFNAFPEINYVSISDSQRRDVPDLHWVATVHHGVDVASFDFYPNPGEYLCFVGRISPEKRPDRAIEIAKRAGIPLKIAAKVDPKDEKYFHREIEPLMNHPLIEYLGQVDERRKRELMGNAMALVLPIDWPEPFGMVFIEALACGTPVLTCPLGSVPELLRDGVTGCVRCTVDDLVAAVKELPKISRRGCRRYAEKRFDTRRMALEYVNVYSRVQGRRALFARPETATPAVGANHVEEVALP